MGRCGRAGNTAIALIQYRLDLLRFHFAFADADQRADNASAHLVEEPIAFDDDGEQPALLAKG